MEPTPLTLELGVANRRELAPGAVETATLDLAAGELVRITALQDGLDVVLRWFWPGEEEPSLLIDSPNGDRGKETLVAVAATAGIHRLEIQAATDARDPGYYEVKLEDRRLATEKDRRAADLVSRFAAGEDVRRGGDSEGALAVYQDLLPVARELEDSLCEATLLYRVGWMEANLSRWDRSIPPFEKAISLFRSLGDHFMEATSLNRCGDAYRAQFRVAEAQIAHQRALDLFKGEQDVKGTVSTLVNLGTDQFQAGALDEAIATLNQASHLAERFPFPDLDVLVRSTLGELLASRGDFGHARIEIETSVDEATALSREDLAALALMHLAEIDLRGNRLEEAKERYSHALEVFRRLKRPRSVIAARLGLGSALLRSKELEPAREQFEKARQIAQQVKALDGEAVSAMNIGRYYYERGEDALSVNEYQEAITLFERLGDQAGIAANRFGIARSLCRDGHLEAALGSIDQSLAGIGNLRSGTANYELRTTHLAIKREYAELQVEILMRLFERDPDSKFAERALAATEKARASQLVDLLAEARVGRNTEVAGPIVSEADSVRQKIEGFEQQRQKLYEQETDFAMLARLNEEKGRLLARLEQLRVDARRANPRYSQIEPSQTLDAAGMEKQLQSGDALLVYWLAEPRSFLWVVSKGRRDSFLLPSRSQLESLARRYVELVSSLNPHDVDAGREAGRALAAQILVPARLALAGTRWIVVADGALQRVPFAALPNPASPAGTPVLERIEVVHVPSATVLEALRSGVRKPYVLDSLAVLADPVFAGDGRGHGLLHALPNTRREAEAIAELAGPRARVVLKLGIEVNREAVLGSNLKGFKVLHFATHGVIHPAHLGLSGLELSQIDSEGSRIEGALRLEDIYALNLDAELVVLSAYNTGVGPTIANEGVASLARGLFYAGAPRLIVSLWPVDDASTVELMRLFYSQLLRQNRPPSLALREAQREMRRSAAYSDPYYWAGFVFIGDWRIDSERLQGPIETKDVGGPSPIGRPPIDLPGPPPAAFEAGQKGGPQVGPSVMSERGSDIEEPVVTIGLDGATGRYLLPPLSREQLGQLVSKVDPGAGLQKVLFDWREGKTVHDPLRAPSRDVEDPTDLGDAGWGIIFADDTSPGVRQALEPLITLRREQAKGLFVDLEHESGDTYHKFMSRIGARPGSRVVPERLPYYLLLVGDPAKMSFRFQSELDVQYAVGRLHFDSENTNNDPDACEAYAAYAKAVVAAEVGSKRRKEIAFFSVENPGDEGTRRLARELVEPLSEVLRKSRSSWKTNVIGTPDAKRERLRRLLIGPERPSILFTSGHGVGSPNGDKRQIESQGALVCQDWAGPSQRLSSDHYFAASDVPDGAELSGLIAFLFASYSAGTPQFDEFQGLSGLQAEIAPYPFVARLPQKLLAKGTLAVIGHVDRAWTSSFSWNGEGGHVQVYSDVLKQLMDGLPIGWAMEAMASYFSAQAASLHVMRDDLRFFQPQDFATYADLWRETNDARNFVVLGDPAVRLNFD